MTLKYLPDVAKEIAAPIQGRIKGLPEHPWIKKWKPF